MLILYQLIVFANSQVFTSAHAESFQVHASSQCKHTFTLCPHHPLSLWHLNMNPMLPIRRVESCWDVNSEKPFDLSVASECTWHQFDWVASSFLLLIWLRGRYRKWLLQVKVTPCQVTATFLCEGKSEVVTLPLSHVDASADNWCWFASTLWHQVILSSVLLLAFPHLMEQHV